MLERSLLTAFPRDGLRGGRVPLRRFSDADITAEYLRWLRDPQVVRFSNQSLHRHDEISARAYLDSFSGTDNLFLSICRLDDERRIGTMTAYASCPHETADVGIRIGDADVRGMGFSQDAWSTLLDWLQSEMRIRKVTAGTVSLNHLMIRLMDRSGMHDEASRRAQGIIEGQPSDRVYYARFRTA